MTKYKLIRRLSLPVFGAVLILSGLLFFFNTAHADEEGPGDVCVQHYLPAANCTANDVRIRAMYIKNLHDPCGADNILVADFDIVFETAQPTRYDVSFFIATDAATALTGTSCYHANLTPVTATVSYITTYYPDLFPELYDQLPTPAEFTGFFDIDADACADMDGQTQAIRMVNLAIACVDRNNNGVHDISICNSWDINQQSVCTGIQVAYPGTSSKCGCAIIDLYTPTDVALTSIGARSTPLMNWFIPALAAGLFIGSVGIVFLVKKLVAPKN